jgi:hypothetical protein
LSDENSPVKQAISSEPQKNLLALIAGYAALLREVAK